MGDGLSEALVLTPDRMGAPGFTLCPSGRSETT